MIEDWEALSSQDYKVRNVEDMLMERRRLGGGFDIPR